MKKILTALSFDDTGQAVFDQAIALAKATQAQLRLLNVLTLAEDASIAFSPYSDLDWKEYVELHRAKEADSLKQLEQFSTQAQAIGVAADVAQDMGNPGPVICKQSKLFEADLVIVGSHGRMGLSELFLGSVSNYVVHHSVCSVMVVRPEC